MVNWIKFLNFDFDTVMNTQQYLDKPSLLVYRCKHLGTLTFTPRIRVLGVGWEQWLHGAKIVHGFLIIVEVHFPRK